jgi:hypothetical protein
VVRHRSGGHRLVRRLLPLFRARRRGPLPPSGQRFRSPARLGDEISVGVGVSTITDRRVGFVFDIRERGSGRLICEASYRVACVDATTFATRAFPSDVVSLLRPAIGASIEPGPDVEPAP